VLALGLIIFGIIRGLAWLCGGRELDELPYWLLNMYGVDRWGGWQPWRRPVMIAVVLVVLFLVLLALIIGRRRSRHSQEAETRVLFIGSWALYLPSVVGSLPAVFGVVAMMGTPFIAAGLVPVVTLFLPQDMANWVFRGIVGSWDGYEELHHSLTAIAQPIVAVGLALTIVGFVQVFRTYKEKRPQTHGLYTIVRHPQHLGIAIWTFGTALAANTTAGYMMWFTVTYFYVLLALREERLLSQQFGSVYDNYRRNTPFMIPFINIGLPMPRPGAWRTAALIAFYVVGMVVLCKIMGVIGVTIVWFV
jgi:protein-S-isoprenylcysteine O-methyltransferase Ste14